MAKFETYGDKMTIDARSWDTRVIFLRVHRRPSDGTATVTDTLTLNWSGEEQQYIIYAGFDNSRGDVKVEIRRAHGADINIKED